MKQNDSLNRTAPHKGGGSPSDDCNHGWHAVSPDNPQGMDWGCPGWEPGYAEFPAITCTCTCHKREENES